ncbi:type I 3-dehydroquinase-domain-containing protein [Penicillium cataractarum]|uniref:Type I 3-dehydroquinase-domain-containing protein n=1 Tax=Penicillium cataractarum TaxID=2100454 RepID=A0A9W9RDF0_9EURO|nr:type I 3-dehydroquinase-domain-containing protein [Penicillium cataractarum]KAJ5355483.1 type I 3-dehydroquinase-domain-containing protein [Penicillium cataractarum]
MSHQTCALSSKSPSIVLIGSRGCGKRTLAFIGALHLRKRLVVADRYFETVTSLSRIEYLQKYGESALQQRTVEVVLSMLRENDTDCVIECGLGSLSTEVQRFLTQYKATHPVIYIMRHFGDIKKLLKLDESNAKRLEETDSKHRSCSDFEYYNIFDPGARSQSMSEIASSSPQHLKQARVDFCHFLNLVCGPDIDFISNPPSPFEVAFEPVENRPFSYALAIKLSELCHETFDHNLLEAGIDAIRLLVDTNEGYSLELITEHIAFIRRTIQLPIVYEVIGFDTFQHEESAALQNDYVQLVHHGIRNCAEYVVVNIDIEEPILRGLISQKRRTKIVGSFHDQDPAQHSWHTQPRLDKYRHAQNLGCDLVQLTQVATSRDDNEELVAFFCSISLLSDPRLPLIAYNLGPLGKSSMVFNKILTPVRPATPLSDFDGSFITAQTAMKGLFATFVLDPLKFYHVGASVSWSPFPPAMHTAAYQACGLEHSYQIFETHCLENIETIIRDPNFGGASVSLPFKTSIMSSIDIQSHHAKAIGAINTLLPLRESPGNESFSAEYQASQRNRAGRVIGWYGDNTDWLGIFECVHRNLSPRNAIQPSKTTALVIGAGGVARAAVYALIKLGCRKIFIFNRTSQHANQMAEHFNSWARSLSSNSATVSVIGSIDDPWPSGLQPATIIVSCIPAHSIDGQPPANFTLPESWIQSKSGGVVADLAYRPLETPLLKQIRHLRATTKIPWITIDGLEMLAIQAIHQFELMTGRRAPRAVMKSQITRFMIE